MKTLAIRSDSWLQVLMISGLNLGFSVLGFQVLGFTVFVILESKKLKPCEGIWACQRIGGIGRGQTKGLQRISYILSRKMYPH